MDPMTLHHSRRSKFNLSHMLRSIDLIIYPLTDPRRPRSGHLLQIHRADLHAFTRRRETVHASHSAISRGSEAEATGRLQRSVRRVWLTDDCAGVYLTGHDATEDPEATFMEWRAGSTRAGEIQTPPGLARTGRFLPTGDMGNLPTNSWSMVAAGANSHVIFVPVPLWQYMAPGTGGVLWYRFRRGSDQEYV